MNDTTTEQTKPVTVDFSKIDFDSIPVEAYEQMKKSARKKGLEKISNLRVQLIDQEKLHLITESDQIDSCGQTVAAMAQLRQKEGVTLQELSTIMQPELLRRAIKNLEENKVINVVKLFPDGKDSGNLKHIYAPEFTPTRKQN